VLVLDEPTDGLDPNQKHAARELIFRMGQTKAIAFSTHILKEVEAACTRAVIIDRGAVVANGTPAELRARSATAGFVRVALAEGGSGADAMVAQLGQLPGASHAELLSGGDTAADGYVTVPVYPKRDDGGAAGAALTVAVAQAAQAGQSLPGQDRVRRGRGSVRGTSSPCDPNPKGNALGVAVFGSLRMAPGPSTSSHRCRPDPGRTSR
jgi:hypothetical protein